MLGMSFAVIRFFESPASSGRSISSIPLSSAAGIASQKWRKAFFSKPMSTNIAFKPMLDVLDPALVNAPDDVAGAVTFDAVFFEAAVLEERHATLQFLHADDELVARLARGKA